MNEKIKKDYENFVDYLKKISQEKGIKFEEAYQAFSVMEMVTSGAFNRDIAKETQKMTGGMMEKLKGKLNEGDEWKSDE